jgi:hypothetical protein
MLMWSAMNEQIEFYGLHHHRRNASHKTGTYSDEAP